MKAKLAVWILSVLLCWMAWPVGAPSALANGLAGSSGCVDNTWAATSIVDAPSARTDHTAIWTGTEIIVWGGWNDTGYPPYYFNTGGRYNPATDTWVATSTNGAPSARYKHTAVWTGKEMLVWGGCGNPGCRPPLNTGGRYDPATDTWRAISTDGAPSPRAGHTAVWTGTEMIVWGGWNGGSYFNSGGRYDPATDTWRAISTEGAPSPRAGHKAVWTGTEMIVWGGYYYDGTVHDLDTGGRYDPATDTWTPTSTVNAPSARERHTAVWTGTEMIIWGGYSTLNTGGRYDPETDTWAATSIVGAPSGRQLHTAVWTGTEMIVWGGYNGSVLQLNTGGRYDPATDTWAATSTVDAPYPRFYHAAFWTSTEMIVWGGGSYDDSLEVVGLNTGGRYCASAAGEGQ